MKWIVAGLLLYGLWWLLLRKPAKPKRSALSDARDVLGVSVQASETDIRAAHRRLMAELHPDRGGSAERARQVNAARDTLLERLRG